MRSTRLGLFALIVLFSTSLVFGQNRPKLEIFGGYSYLHGLSSGSGGINGAEGSASWNFNNRFAADFDVSGYHESAGGATGNSYFYLAGPRLNFGPLFVHGLVGGAHSNASVLGFSDSANSLGAALGGGFQWPIVKHISFRTSADYMLTNAGGSVQNSARVSVGLVFGFGAFRHRQSVPQSSTLAPGNQPAPSLGVMGHPGEGGFIITAVNQGSIASHMGLAPGDVILKINGTPVSSGLDIEKVMGESNSKGTLDYLIQGNWAAQKSF